MQALQRSDIGSYVKRILLADSDDGGRTWHNVRRVLENCLIRLI